MGFNTEIFLFAQEKVSQTGVESKTQYRSRENEIKITKKLPETLNFISIFVSQTKAKDEYKEKNHFKENNANDV